MGPQTRRERIGTGEERTGHGPRTSVMRRRSMIEEAQARADETGRCIIIHNGAAWGANGGGQRPEQLARELERDACVIHMHGANPNRIQRPVTEAVVTSMGRAADWFAIEAEHRVLYSGFPEAALWNLLGEIDSSAWPLWYDCIDDWGDFDAPWYSRMREQNIIARSALVTGTARNLVEHAQALGGHDVRYLPNSTRLLEQPTPDVGAEPEVDVVFVGCMSETWLDWELVEALVWEGFTVRLIGDPPRTGKPVNATNLEWYGRVDNAQLRGVLANARVGIIPFIDRPLTHAVWPIKYADYLAAGLPTVAAHLSEIEGEPFCEVTHGVEDFVCAVAEAVRCDWPREEIMQAAQAHTAAARVAQASEWLTEVCAW